MQHGYVVDDARSAAHLWAERAGLEPFNVFDIVLDNYAYRGRPGCIELKIAIGIWNDIQIELIQPLRDDGLYADALRTSPGQINHYGVVVPDIDQLLASRNLQDRVLQSGQAADGLKFVYLERFIPGGLHLELIQPAPGGEDVFEMLSQ
jgi:hypothetical protein